MIDSVAYIHTYTQTDRRSLSRPGQSMTSSCLVNYGLGLSTFIILGHSLLNNYSYIIKTIIVYFHNLLSHAGSIVGFQLNNSYNTTN